MQEKIAKVDSQGRISLGAGLAGKTMRIKTSDPDRPGAFIVEEVETVDINTLPIEMQEKIRAYQKETEQMKAAHKATTT